MLERLRESHRATLRTRRNDAFRAREEVRAELLRRRDSAELTDDAWAELEDRLSLVYRQELGDIADEWDRWPRWIAFAVVGVGTIVFWAAMAFWGYSYFS